MIRTRSLIERHLQCGAVGDRAVRNRLAQIGDLVEGRPEFRIVEPALCLVGDSVQIFVVAAQQLDEDRFFGVEMVIEAAGKNACGVSDFLQRRPQPRGRDDRRRGLQDLGATRAVVVGVAGAQLRRHARPPHVSSKG